MAIFGAVSQQQVTSSVQSRLLALRTALEGVADLYKWISAYSVADLTTALGFTAADAQAVLSALADANELANLYNGGALGSYVLPYDFSASQRMVTGPQ